MRIPYVIDNQTYQLAGALQGLTDDEIAVVEGRV